jgi:hypothetical protein
VILVFCVCVCVCVDEGMHAYVWVCVCVHVYWLMPDLAVDVNEMKFSEFFILN